MRAVLTALISLIGSGILLTNNLTTKDMNDFIVSFKIGKREFAIRRQFYWWFNNGYTQQFMWFYTYKDKD